MLAQADGTPRTMEQVMVVVHEMTEAWTVEYRGTPLGRRK